MKTNNQIPRLISTILVMIALVAFTSSTPIPRDQNDIKSKAMQKIQEKKGSMLMILEALESGEEYQKTESWNGMHEMTSAEFLLDDFYFGMGITEINLDLELPCMKQSLEKMFDLEFRLDEMHEILMDRLEKLERQLEKLELGMG